MALELSKTVAKLSVCEALNYTPAQGSQKVDFHCHPNNARGLLAPMESAQQPTDCMWKEESSFATLLYLLESTLYSSQPESGTQSLSMLTIS